MLENTIPLKGLPGYPTFLTDDATGPNGTTFATPPGLLERFRAVDRFTPEHRDAVADAVLDDLTRWNAPAAAIRAAGDLRSTRSLAVVTGQQAGVATGPLFTLYKAIGAVRSAAELAAANPDRRFVPIFWIEADDHDFDEARRLTILDPSSLPVTLAYDDGDTRPRHVGDRLIHPEGLATILDTLRERLQPTDFTAATLEMLAESYKCGDESLADGFARMIYTILGDTPLVVVNSRNPMLKARAADIFAAEAANPWGLHEAASTRTRELRRLGLPTPVDPKVGALFMTHEGERRSLDLEGDSYRIRGTETTMTREEAARLATEKPAIFSPNVLLRPIVQDAIFPTVIYLGGPGELAYLRQIREAYEVFGMEPPTIAPRPFVLLVEPKVRRVLEGGRFTLEDLLRPDFSPAEALVDSTIDAEIERARARATEQAREAFAGLEELTHTIDPTLDKALAAGAAGSIKSLEDFAKRLRSALKKKEQTAIDRLAAAASLALPGGKLQERALNPIYFLNKYGPEAFRAALARIEPTPGVLQTIDI